METPIALKYAKALFDEGIHSKHLEDVYRDVEGLLLTISESQPFAGFLANPTLSQQDREKAVTTLFSGKLSPTMYQFVLLLAKKERLNHLQDILTTFENMYFEHTGTVRVKVISPFVIADKKLHALVENFAKQLQKKVEPTLEVNPALIGGIKFQVKDQVYDFSVQHQLEKFQKQLLQA